MKILHLCFCKSLGGLELYVKRIGRALEHKGHDCYYALERDGLLSKRIHGKVTLFHPHVRHIDPFAALGTLKLVRSCKAEVLHIHSSRDLAYAALAKIFNPGLKTVFTRHMQSGERKKDPFHRWAYGKIDLLLTITDQLRTTMQDVLPMDAGRIRRLYYGTELPDLSKKPEHRVNVRSQMGLHDRAFLIFFPSRLMPQKGHSLAIEALDIVRQKGLMPHIVFTGRDSPEHPENEAAVRSMIESRNLSRQCSFTGFIDDLNPLYAAADVVVLATKEETFGLVLIEGMAWATPVIGSAAGGVPEIIDHGQNGLLFTSMDAESLALSIERCMREPDSLTEWGRAARATVETKFAFPAHLRALEELYGERDTIED